MTAAAPIVEAPLSRPDRLQARAAQIWAPEALAHAMVGKDRARVAALYPRIFNLCAAAQEGAVRRALDLATAPDLPVRMAAEALREHVLKLCWVWPGMFGLPTPPAPIGLSAQAMVDGEARRALGLFIFGAAGRAPRDLLELRRWAAAGANAAQALFAHLLAQWPAQWGCADLPGFDETRAPDWPTAWQDGRPVENSPAARAGGRGPLLGEIRAVYGPGLVWRMAARLVEADSLLAGEAFDFFPQKGAAFAARGTMLVRAESAGEEVRAFARLSPLDFALVPGGLVELALASLADAPAARRRDLAWVVIESLDPCVPVQVDGEEAPDHA